jgi:tRNA dimethylallyltransferase
VTVSSAPLRFLAILGPTASGKSALAHALALRLGGELVSCDSQQVYIGMDVGTAKPTLAERREIPHHLLDVAHPDEAFHAARWAALARVAMRNIAARGRVPIVVGGTGLYFRALTHGFFAAPPADPAIRARHREEAAALGVEALHARLEGVDASAAAVIGRRDLMRISRALEIYEQTGVPITALRLRAAPPADLAPRVLVLDPPLTELRQRIEERAARMFGGGFEDEVRALRVAGYGPALRPLQALGYSQVGALLDGTCTRDEALAATIAATVAYARRQRTWFRKEAATSRLAGAPCVGELAELAGTLALELAS